MVADPVTSTVEELNEALRLYRRLMLRVFAIVILGFIAAIVLGMLGNALNPPYGIYIAGEGLSTWALIVVLVLLIAELWIDGRAIGRVLKDPALLAMPALAGITAITVIAQRANALGMKWTGFFGPLQPVTKR